MMPKYVSAVVCGLIFGLGLAVSQMALPVKVLGFLDVTGKWDPTLLFVLGGAVGVTVIGFRFVPRMRRPLFDDAFEAPPVERIDRRLILGAGLFGIGWGLSGYCPGPGIVSLGRFAPDAFLFVSAFLVGSWFARKTVLRESTVSSIRSRLVREA